MNIEKKRHGKPTRLRLIVGSLLIAASLESQAQAGPNDEELEGNSSHSTSVVSSSARSIEERHGPAPNGAHLNIHYQEPQDGPGPHVVINLDADIPPPPHPNRCVRLMQRVGACIEGTWRGVVGIASWAFGRCCNRR